MDYFALLNLPRQPWVEEATVKKEFLTQSSATHPDRTHNLAEEPKRSAQECYLNLNAAYQCLRDSRQRVRHFLELQRGAGLNEIQSVPDHLVDLFMEVSNVCREADHLIAQIASTQSPLLKAGMLERSQTFMEQMDGLKSHLAQWRNELEREIKILNINWNDLSVEDASGRNAILDQLDAIQHQMGYAGRWLAQIQERMLKLSF
jgi:hypothetical protein